MQQCNPLIHQQLGESKIQAANSLHSKRFRACSSRKLGQEPKKKNEWRAPGRRRGKKETFAHKPHDFEKLRSPTSAASDWCGVDYLALETSIKQGMLCLHASQIWSHLNFVVALITDGLDSWYLFESCLCKGLWDRSLQSINGDRVVETREGQFIENHDGVQICLQKMDCL